MGIDSNGRFAEVLVIVLAKLRNKTLLVNKRSGPVGETGILAPIAVLIVSDPH